MKAREQQERIEKLRRVVVTRGATPSEELAAKRAIARLEAKSVEPDPQPHQQPNPFGQMFGAGAQAAQGAPSGLGDLAWLITILQGKGVR
jgi:hypothetical protein